jgi:hypothetical protein
LRRVLGEVGVVGDRPATSDGARALRETLEELGTTFVIVGLLVSSALMARLDDTVSVVGLLVSAALGLYWLWKIVRTQGEL